MKATVAVIGLVVAALLAWRVLGHSTPRGQPPLVDLSADTLNQFESAFNNSSGEVRVVALLSPT